ncbi:hypothetical protein NXY40_05740 [Phocaeicola vulgatus]|nr:hypothetical protein [Phocaeicola vulgatus]
MMEKKNILNIKNILRDFSGLAEARRNHTFRTKLVFIFSAVTIAMVLLFAYRVVNGAMNKILVVNEGGEFVHFKAVRQDMLYESLLKNHCYHTAYYLNSFDRLSLQENRARALFLVNKPDANTIFAKYQADRGVRRRPGTRSGLQDGVREDALGIRQRGRVSRHLLVSPEHHQRK